jgi:hypothetical protein
LSEVSLCSHFNNLVHEIEFHGLVFSICDTMLLLKKCQILDFFRLGKLNLYDHPHFVLEKTKVQIG